MHALGTLEQDALPLGDGLVDQYGRVLYVGAQLLGVIQTLRVHRGRVELDVGPTEPTDQPLLDGQHDVQFPSQLFRVHQVPCSDTPPCSLVLVGRTDAPSGRPCRELPLEPLLYAVLQLEVGEDEVGAIAHGQPCDGMARPG